MAVWLSAPHRSRRPARQLHFKTGVIASPLPIVRRIIVLIVALAGIVIDQTASGISSTSLASMQGSFALSPDEGSWILTAFNATYYTSILASAWTITRFGRKRALIAGLLGFAVCSFLCAFAWNFEALLVLRALQGAALGGVFAASVITIIVSVPPASIPQAFVPFSFVSLAASTVGILLGGVFVQYAQWQDTFAAMSAFAVVLAIVIGVVVPTDRAKKRRPFDYAGVVIAFIGCLAFQYVVNEGERRNWFEDPGVTLATFVTIAAAGLFAGWKLRLSRHPFVNFTLLRKRGFVLGALCAGLLSVTQYSGTLLVQYAQGPGTQLSPTVAGTLFALRIVMFAVVIPAVGILVIARKIAVRAVLTVALVAFGALTLMQANRMTSTADFEAFVPLAFALGIVQGAANQPLPQLVFGGLEMAQLPMGAVIYKMAPVLGAAIAGAIAQRFIDVRSARHLSDLAGSVTLARPGVASFVMQHGNAHALAALVAQESLVLAYGDAMRIFGIVALFIIPIIYCIPLPKLQTERVELAVPRADE